MESDDNERVPSSTISGRGRRALLGYVRHLEALLPRTPEKSG